MKRLSVLTFILCTALITGAYFSTPSLSVSFGSFNSKVSSQIPQKKSVTFVGDVMLARNVEYLMDTYGMDYPVTELPKFATSSYLVGNFEASVPQQHISTKNMHFAFSVKESYAKYLSTFGFSHLSLANNHSYDFGLEGFSNTTKVLNSSTTTTFGDSFNQASSTIALLTIKGTSVAIIGLYAVDVYPTLYEIEKLLNKAESQSEVQIVYIHWGEEYKPIHSKTQRELAYSLVDNGADVIIGHHPHVVQDIELYNGKPIFYSLGNFIFDQYFSEDVQKGLVVELTPSYESLTFTLLPITSIGSRSKPRFMSSFEKAEFLEEIAKKSDTELALMIKKGSIQLQR